MITTLQTIDLQIRGEPVAQPRAKAMTLPGHGGGRGFARMYTPDTAKAWKDLVYLAALGKVRAPHEGPVRLEADIYFPRPERLMKKSSPAGLIPHTVKPDRDNLEKAILDAITQAGIWKDDCQVYDGPVRKWWVAKGATAGAVITIELQAFSDQPLLSQETRA